MEDDEIVYNCYDLTNGTQDVYSVADLKGLCNLIVSILTQCPDEELAEQCLMNIQCCDTFYDENDDEYTFPAKKREGENDND